jgi:RimJ/RimL family protein N-acetyltransferase
MATIVSHLTKTTLGESCLVRNPEIGDAQAWIDHAVAVAQESDFTKTDPEDLVSSVREQETWFTTMNSNGGDLALLAEIDGHLVGILYCRAFKARRMSHVCAFAISVRKDRWAQGVGTALGQALLRWATDHPVIRKITMRVLVDNTRALSLYRKFGFFVEGRFAQAIKAADGTFVDDYEMAIFVKPK